MNWVRYRMDVIVSPDLLLPTTSGLLACWRSVALLADCQERRRGREKPFVCYALVWSGTDAFDLSGRRKRRRARNCCFGPSPLLARRCRSDDVSQTTERGNSSIPIGVAKASVKTQLLSIFPRKNKFVDVGPAVVARLFSFEVNPGNASSRSHGYGSPAPALINGRQLITRSRGRGKGKAGLYANEIKLKLTAQISLGFCCRSS